jgi:hypothetical protein
MSVSMWVTAGLLAWFNASFISASNISALTLQLSPGAEVLYSDDPNWSNSVQRWNVYGAPTFFASIRPATAQDLQAIVGACFAQVA